VGPGSDQILAGDLAKGFPQWAAVPPETPLALAPAPGVQRIFRALELRRLEERWNVAPVPEGEVCVTRRTSVISAERLMAAMQKELPAAHIVMFDCSRQPAPEGAIAFPASGLRQGPAGGYWYGYVTYGGVHRFRTWARVKVMVAAPRVVAAQDLEPGLEPNSALLRVEVREEVPANGFVSVVEEVSGKVLRRSVAAGTALRAEWFAAAKAVLRGQTVQVEAIHGGARLELECVAEASGAIGETIPILNPVSKRRFPALIQSKGKVLATKGSL